MKCFLFFDLVSREFWISKIECWKWVKSHHGLFFDGRIQCKLLKLVITFKWPLLLDQSSQKPLKIQLKESKLNKSYFWITHSGEQLRDEGSVFLRRPQKFGKSSSRFLHKCQNHDEDLTHYCGLLRKAELYDTSLHVGIKNNPNPKSINKQKNHWFS